uniref:Uncharacterized protein n=1 Tax=Ananas comosus var. bracteatus TaxID=296719 RepID=A0A6V7Q5U6_ANACO|nr:unnamed protein product [Ananas comosus var. bracteatus]
MTPQNKSTQGVVKTYPNTINVISADSQSIACFGQESSKLRVCSGNWTEVMDLAMLNLIIEEHVLDNFINAVGRGGTTITTFRPLVIPVIRDTVISENSAYARYRVKPFPAYHDKEFLSRKTTAIDRYGFTTGMHVAPPHSPRAQLLS